MPVYLGQGQTLGFEAQLEIGKIRVSPASLKIDIVGFKYDIGGNRGTYDGYSSLSVTDNDTSYVYLSNAASLVVNTTGFPSTTHIPLGRVVASSGEIVAVHEERILLASSSSSTGTCVICYPVDGDIRGGDTSASSNNNWAAIAYAGSGTDTNGRNRWVRRPPQNYLSGNLVLRVYFTLASDPGNNKESYWKLKYSFRSVDDALGTHDGEVATQVDHNPHSADTLYSFDLTVPEADVDVSKNLMMFMLTREHADANDDLTDSIYVHQQELRYTGTLLAGQAGQ